MKGNFNNFVAKNFFILEIILGSIGFFLMLIAFFYQTMFGNEPVHANYFADSKGIKSYLMDFPKLYYLVWFGIARMMFYCMILIPVIYLQYQEWKISTKSFWWIKLLKIILVLLPIIIVRLKMGKPLTNQEYIDNSVFNCSYSSINAISHFGESIATICAAGIVLVAINANDAVIRLQNSYKKNIKSIYNFLVILGITISFSAMWHQVLREAYVQVNPTLAHTYPIEVVYANALLNTLMIAVIYLPIRLQIEYLNYQYNTLAGAKPVDLTVPSILVNTVFNEFKTVVPILSPILSTMLAGLLN